jgi:acyl dehydratase
MMTAARHVLRQGGVVAALAEAAVPALLRRFQLLAPTRGTIVVPGPEIVARVAPRPRALSRDYVRHVGGDPRSYEGFVPPHLFPQWTFPTVARTLRGLPFPMLEVVNGGCRLEMQGPLPADEPLEVRARLESIEDDGRRAVLRQRVVTGPAASPRSLVADLVVVVPSAARAPRGPSAHGARGEMGANGPPSPRKDRPRVPSDARELAYWSLRRDAGLHFSMLTGDFNPVHWSRRYARAFGFGGAILHGFSTMARAIEGLHRAVFSGAVDRLHVVDVRFTRPLALPARVGLYLEGNRFFVGDAPGGPAYLVGTYVEAATGASARPARRTVSRPAPSAQLSREEETRL